VLGSADVVVVMMMEPVAKLVEARGVEAKRIVAASMGVDLSRFTGLTREACRAKVGLSDEKTRIALYAGHLYAWKGVYLLAEAMKSVPDVTCWMVGGLAEDLAKMETFLREKDIQNVVLKGTVAPAEVPFFLKAADVLVVPSPSIDPAHAAENKSSEPQGLLGFGTPMKLFEYMASGTPIVATDVVAHRQVLHNQNSVVVKSDSVPALSDGIREALSDPKKSAARAKNASETAKSFDWSRRSVPILAKIKELYPDRAD
jgi:glycosyltransferase involved in cell wall biosynthesis